MIFKRKFKRIYRITKLQFVGIKKNYQIKEFKHQIITALIWLFGIKDNIETWMSKYLSSYYVVTLLILNEKNITSKFQQKELKF